MTTTAKATTDESFYENLTLGLIKVLSEFSRKQVFHRLLIFWYF
jgi:hypothetical protein